MKFLINGKFLARDVNGQGRVAIEIIKELDHLVQPDFVEIIAPESPFTIDNLDNIEIKRIGETNGNGHIWEQTTFYSYLRKSGCTCINFFNSHPLFRPDIAYIHDMVYFSYPKMYTTLYGKFQRIYNVFMEKVTGSRARNIITVSNFSKEEIIKYLNTPKDKIHVLYDGWQHMSNVMSDDGIFDRYPNIKKGEYYLAASAISPQKNFNWIIKNAKKYPNNRYVIIGGKIESTQDEMNDTQNVIFTGRLSDSEMKALMSNCKAFIHPAVYEGFGMTPLEAAGCGCPKLIVANASCLPEIYGNYAYYIDPKNPDIDLENLIKENRPDLTSLLNKYSWKQAAEQLYEILKK